MKKKSRLQSISIHLLVAFAAITATVLVSVIMSGISHTTPEAFADFAEHNARGYLYSANVGWISMSCNTTGTCANVIYGVDVDLDTGNVSGTAYSDYVGWITFDQSTCGNVSLDLATGNFSGSAQVVSAAQYADQAGGWNGCLSLSGSTYGVTADVLTGTVSGYGWEGNNVGLDTSVADLLDGYDGNTAVGLGWVDFSGMFIEIQDLPGNIDIAVSCPVGSENDGFNFSAGFTEQLAMQDGNVNCQFTGDFNDVFNVTSEQTSISIDIDDQSTHSFGLTCTNSITGYSETVPLNDLYTFDCDGIPDDTINTGFSIGAPIACEGNLPGQYEFSFAEDFDAGVNQNCSYYIGGQDTGVGVDLQSQSLPSLTLDTPDLGSTQYDVSIVCSDTNSVSSINTIQCGFFEGDKPQCSDDGYDNDGDTLADEGDPSCHVGCKLSGAYMPMWNNEASECSPAETDFCAREENINNPNCVGQAPIYQEN